MKILSIVLFVFLLCLGEMKGSEVPTTDTSSLDINNQLYCSRPGISCYDRYTIQHCAETGASGLEFTVSCKLQNPNRPYCMEYENQVECIPMDISTSIQDEPEICNKQGTRPDPLDCSRYIECAQKQTGNGYFGSVVNCPSGTGYNINEQGCRSYGSCTTVHSYCTGNEDKLIAYPPYPSIYVKCPSTNSKDKYVIKLCKDGKNFNEKIGSCRPICKQSGYIPNYENCKAYYNCVTTIGGIDLFSISSNICPQGTGFNRNTRLCDENKAGCTNSKFRDFFVDY